MSVSRVLRALLALLAALVAGAPALAADDFLDPAAAFRLAARALPDKRVELTYKIAPGYYLYRERFKFDSPDAKLGPPQIPAGLKHYDSALEQTVEIYHGQVVVTLPVTSAPGAFTIHATHQGCAEKGLCYPPQPRTLQVTMKAFGGNADSIQVASDADSGTGGGTGTGTGTAGTGGAAAAPGDGANPAATVSVATAPPATASLRASLLGSPTAVPPPGPATMATPSPSDGPPAAATPAPTALPPATAARGPVASPVDTAPAAPARAPATTDDDRLAAALHGGHLWVILTLAFGFGLLLSMTPCVWPMLPILSSIIVGQGGSVTPLRGFGLAAAYSLGMALVYTALGVAAGLAGQGLAAFLQSPPVLITFGLLLAVLSLSMFGVYELQLPARWRDRLNAKNQALTGGQVGGVFAMGVLSALIVSPCVSAPLAAALLYISQTRDAVLGGAALFAIAAGMSVPLLVIGTSAGTLLPRSGAWMERVKLVFGLLLLAVAIYIVQPVLSGLVAMIGWGVLLVLGAASLGAFEPVPQGPRVGAARLMKGFGLVLALLGVLQFVGLASGGRDPAQPLAAFAQSRSTDGGTIATATAATSATTTTATTTTAEPSFIRVATLDELDRRLQSTDRPVMLDFYADWCVSCKEMEKDVFVEPAVKSRLAHAVLLRADVTANTAQDRALLKRFDLFGPPGIIFFDASGRELVRPRVVGYEDSSRFAATLGDAGL